MESDDRVTGDHERPATKLRSYLFAVRLWKEDVVGGVEYRGNVRDVMGGVFRNFRDWSELVAFMCARIEENEQMQTGLLEDGMETNTTLAPNRRP